MGNAYVKKENRGRKKTDWLTKGLWKKQDRKTKKDNLKI
jgi:hypothetical protein